MCRRIDNGAMKYRIAATRKAAADTSWPSSPNSVAMATMIASTSTPFANRRTGLRACETRSAIQTVTTWIDSTTDRSHRSFATVESPYVIAMRMSTDP